MDSAPRGPEAAKLGEPSLSSMGPQSSCPSPRMSSSNPLHSHHSPPRPHRQPGPHSASRARRKTGGTDTDRVCKARWCGLCQGRASPGRRRPWRVGTQSMSTHLEFPRPARGWGVAGVAGGGWTPGGGREAPGLGCRQSSGVPMLETPSSPGVPTHKPPGGWLTCDCFSCRSRSSSSFL